MSINLDSLNTPQREAVEHTEGPLLVLAGAGTGKTKVLTTRIAHILDCGLAHPNEILAVTFTNKAAREMVERIEHMTGTSSAGMWVGTFHSLCARMLRSHAEAVGLDPNFTILDTDDQKRVVEEIMVEKNIDKERWPSRMIVNIISKWKDEAKRPSDLTNDDASAINGQGKEVYEMYQRRLKQLNVADFGDLLLETVVLFKNEPAILQRYQQQFRYMLVDEYQDTNVVQYLWLRLLAMGHKNICVVGDDDQSIYAWRGAQVGNILKFDKDFPGAYTVRLEQNYRSTGHILKAASHLIKQNSERHAKTLWCDVGDGEKIEVHPCLDDREEARMIADDIERNVSNDKTYDQHAVLFRTAAQTRSVEERFLQSGTPYQVIGGLRFYERKEIRDAIAYFKLVHSNQQDLAFERIINVPKRAIGKSTIDGLKDIQRELNVPLLQCAEIAVAEERLGASVANKLRPFIDNITLWRQQINNMEPDRMMEQILEQSGYVHMLTIDKDPAAKTRLENLKELVRALQDYSDINDFLEHVSLVMDKEEDQPNSVKLMTVHGAKGLEFDTVFLPGFEEGLFPHQRSLNEEGAKGLEEERRLAYVAITRAKRRLVLSYTSSRRMYGTFTSCVASRFLNELPEKSLNIKPATGYQSGFAHRPSVGSTAEVKWQGGKVVKREPMVSMKSSRTSEDGLKVGQRVRHAKFGFGRVDGIEGSGENQRLSVFFDKAGPKKLVASLAKLEAA